MVKPEAGVQPRPAIGGLAGWIASRLSRSARSKPRLEMVDRIALGPRQTVALVEADGRRFLVASSPEAGASFYPLDAQAGVRVAGQVGTRAAAGRRAPVERPARVSW
jgi:hypothetical protein